MATKIEALKLITYLISGSKVNSLQPYSTGHSASYPFLINRAIDRCKRRLIYSSAVESAHAQN